MENKKAVKAGIGYTIGNFLIKGINFIAVPIFSRLMTTEEFGNYNTFISYDSFLYVFIGLALHSSLKSAYYKFSKIDQYVSSISILYLINMSFFMLLGVLFSTQISKVLGLEKEAIPLLVIYSTCSALVSLYNERASIDYEYKKYLKLAFINSFTTVAYSLVMILTVFKLKRDFGRMVGSTLAVFFLGIYILYSFYKDNKPIINKEYWLFGLRYSFPIIPHGVSQVILTQFDRIMIKKYYGSFSVGIYSFASYLQLILLVITNSISVAWHTWMFEKMNENNAKEIVDKASLLSLLFLFASISLMVFTPELIMFLGGEKYIMSIHVAIPMIETVFILFIYNLLIPCEYYLKKTNYIMYGTVGVALINIVLNIYCVNKLDYIACAYSTLLSYILYMVYHVFITNKVLKLEIIPAFKIILYCITLLVYGLVIENFIHSLFIRVLFYAISIILCLFLRPELGAELFRIIRERKLW